MSATTAMGSVQADPPESGSTDDRIGRDRGPERFARPGCPEPAALARGNDGKHAKVEQHQKGESVQSIIVGAQSEPRPTEPQHDEGFGHHCRAQHHGDDDKAADFPGLRPPGGPDMISGEGDFREVGEKNEQQHGKGRNDEFSGHDECYGDEGRLQYRSTDLGLVSNFCLIMGIVAMRTFGRR